MTEKTIEELEAELALIQKGNLQMKIDQEKKVKEESDKLRKKEEEDKLRDELKKEVEAEFLKEQEDTSKVDTKPETLSKPMGKMERFHKTFKDKVEKETGKKWNGDTYEEIIGTLVNGGFE